MRFLSCIPTLLITVFFASPAISADAKDPAKTDAIKGSWKVVKRVKNGHETPAEQVAHPLVVLTFDRNVLTERKGEEKEQAGAVTYDDAQSPKQITMTGKTGDHAGQSFVGIYELAGNTLKIAYSLQGGKPPADFEGGEGAGLLVLERLK